eukprot:TRINITY_DN4832_c0_g1_i4.p1 TRINITY_DN4832_c0_g1~~TRINITY_DN4832_c0_g1_i4.p1  ORF type:complete len:172 (-),score=13.36 TRINITY_DN4832_c0_g1_i4:393-908(-)
MLRSLVGSEMCIRDSINAEYGEQESARNMQALPSTQPKPRSEYTRQFQAYVQDALQGYTPRQGKFHGPIEDMGLTPDQVTKHPTRHMALPVLSLTGLSLCVGEAHDRRRNSSRRPRERPETSRPTRASALLIQASQAERATVTTSPSRPGACPVAAPAPRSDRTRRAHAGP